MWQISKKSRVGNIFFIFYLKSEVNIDLGSSLSQAMVAHSFYPSTQDSEASTYLSLRAVLTTERIPGQPVLHRNTLS